MGRLVLLLKSEAGPPGTEDPYHTLLSRHGFTPVSIAVIDHNIVDLDSLKIIVRNGSSGYRGVIFTSGRAVDAWITAASSVPEVSGIWRNPRHF